MGWGKDIWPFLNGIVARCTKVYWPKTERLIYPPSQACGLGGRLREFGPVGNQSQYPAPAGQRVDD